MERLNLRDFRGFIVGRKCPNLIGLDVAIGTRSFFTQFIEKNPQIRHLDIIENVPIEFLTTVGEHLKQLETLSFTIPNEFRSYRGPIINFNHVNKIGIIDLNNNFKNNKMVFNAVRQIKLLVRGMEISDEWIECFSRNKCLEVLTSTGYFNDQSLLKSV